MLVFAQIGLPHRWPQEEGGGEGTRALGHLVWDPAFYWGLSVFQVPPVREASGPLLAFTTRCLPKNTTAPLWACTGAGPCLPQGQQTLLVFL